MRRSAARRSWALAVALAAALSGCALTDGRLGVEPWERGTLARADMALDPSPIMSGIDDHIYFSKEATSGGRGFAGGGCGCN